MKLQCLRNFNEYDMRCSADDVVDVPTILGHYLLSNFPAAFVAASPVTPDPVAVPPSDNRVETVAFDGPQKDKMVRKPKHKK